MFDFLPAGRSSSLLTLQLYRLVSYPTTGRTELTTCFKMMLPILDPRTVFQDNTEPTHPLICYIKCRNWEKMFPHSNNILSSNPFSFRWLSCRTLKTDSPLLYWLWFCSGPWLFVEKMKRSSWQRRKSRSSSRSSILFWSHEFFSREICSCVRRFVMTMYELLTECGPADDGESEICRWKSWETRDADM